MSELAFPWVSLRPSVRAGRLLALALAFTTSAALATVAAALLAPTPARGLAAAATVAAAVLAAALGRRRTRSIQLRVTPAAAVLMRAGADSEPRPMRVLFVAPWLIVLAEQGRPVPVWPDRLGSAEFRRLAAACRWGRAAADA